MKMHLHCNWVRTEKRGDHVQITTRKDNTGILVAEVPGSPVAMDEALLLAAAPRLAAMLAELCDALPNGNRAAIVKAELKARNLLASLPVKFTGRPGNVSIVEI